MARNEQLIRQLKILQILERVRFGKTIEEIRQDVVDELGLSSIHPRTLKRDLEALQAAGIDVADHDTQRGKVWKLGPLAKSPTKITASSTELISLFIGRQLLYSLAGTPFWIGIESFWNKILDGLPEPVIEHFEKYKKIMRILGVQQKSYEKHHGMLNTIHRAILEHRVLEIKYHSLENPGKTRRIEPYAVVLYQSSLYIIGPECDSDKGIRNWKLDRFEKASALDEWFKVPNDVNVDDYVGGNRMGIFIGKEMKKFKIWISKEAAQWVREEPWHPDQKIKELKDGSIELTVSAADERAIFPSVLSFGDEARIISPAKSREKLKAKIESMLKSYK